MKNRRKYYNNYHLKNKKRRNAYSRKYWKLHKKRLVLYKKLRKRKFINLRIASNLRTRIWCALKGICKSAHTMELIGCDIKFLKKYLKKQFKYGMTWKNYGQWHIDHIIPCIFFDLRKESEQRKCFYYSNLQPLWAEDNRRKGNKGGKNA